MIHADTDSLLDKCHCGAVAGFEKRVNGCWVEHRARCTECVEQTVWFAAKGDAAIDWTVARMMERESV